ncbi:ATP-binding protein [Alteromonas flava]|uniref:ATP-binding protein n=1 Tax=Alteromonas flava TaxID=2048003 RepID=UPI000C2903B0|nr:ATP-binding protein [Alteromonas flava]
MSRSWYHSIRFRVIAMLTLAMLLLALQNLMSLRTKTTMTNSIEQTQRSLADVSTVLQLERDVIDLQRNVLIFKDSASLTAVSRFDRLFQQISENVGILRTSPYFVGNQENLNRLDRMQEHLRDYETNFRQVIAARDRRTSLLNDQIYSSLTKLRDFPAQETVPEDSSNAQLELLITLLENHILAYLERPDSSHIQGFTATLEQLQVATNEYLSPVGAINYSVQLDQLQDGFLLLTQLTSGNLFLINVVMSGSANEFLYLTNALVEEVTDSTLAATALSQTNSANARQFSNLIAGTVLFVMLLMMIYLVTRVILPITEMTKVFRKIAAGERDVTIPALTRKDEVGELASAADVFKLKSEQAFELLQDATVLNEELSKERNRAEQATASKSIFLANMSHEIRTPLNGVIGLLDLARKEALTDKVENYLSKASFSSNILMNVINDILDFSKIEAGKLEIETTSFSLHSLFNTVVSIVGLRAKEKNLPVVFVADPDMPPQCLGDPMRISQILLNLCSNAVKFTHKGQVTITLTHTMNAAGNGMQLKFLVEDTGVGMTNQQLANIFNPFTQADSATTRQFGGTGLGLSIVKQLTELMGGKVFTCSELGKGSSFCVSLPLRTFKNQKGLFDLNCCATLPSIIFQNTPVIPPQYAQNACIDIAIHSLDSLEDKSSLLANKNVLLGINREEELDASLNRLLKLNSNYTAIGLVTRFPLSSGSRQRLRSLNATYLYHPFTPLQWQSFVCSLNNLPAPNLEAKPSEITTELSGHVLLVEDNTINQVVAGEMLSQMGVTHDIAEDGEQAVLKVKNKPTYDAVLMDIQMPVMDGYAATQQLRQEGFDHLPIIGLSANAMREDFARAKEAGMNDYLTKPIKSQALYDKLKEYLVEKDPAKTS